MSQALPPELRVDRRAVELHMRNYPLQYAIPSVLHDVDRLPPGGALVVGNHGPLALDTGLLVHAVLRDTGLILRGLGDRFLHATALTRAWARSFGGVEASPENALALLRAGEYVLVYPGGARETLRTPAERYQLKWEGRYGFARIALTAPAPIVPVACVGLDEQLLQLATHEEAARSLPGRWIGALVGKKNIPPLYVPRLRRTPFHYWFGEPIHPEPLADEAPETLERAAIALQARVKREVEALIERGRAARREKLQEKRESEAPSAPAGTPADEASPNAG